MRIRLAIALMVAVMPAMAAANGTAQACASSPGDVTPGPVRRFDGVRIGVALGSGSTHGMAHVGVLAALEESGIDVTVVAGTSVGALVGALWASGLTASRIGALAAADNWDDMASFSPGREGLFSGAALRSKLEEIFAGRPIEGWPRRFGAVATNLRSGQRRLLSSGDGALAVAASTAIPALFSPVVVAGEKLVDGSLVEPVPVDAARALGADYVIAVDVAYRPYEDAASGITGIAFQALHILTNSLGERLARSADFALRLDVHHALVACGAPGAVHAGREAMRRGLPKILGELARRSASTGASGPGSAGAEGRP